MKQTHNLTRSRLPAFTLVELIVVITILAIIATIGFISLSGYGENARNSVRISDISTIEKVFSLYSVGSETFPLPDNAVTLTSSGEIIGYQGELGDQVLLEIRQAGKIVDPLSNTPYTYTVNAAQSSYQILSFMEGSVSQTLQNPLSPQTYANTYLTRFPRLSGSRLGILTDNDNVPIQELALPGDTLDIADVGALTLRSFLTADEFVTGTSTTFSVLQSVMSSRGIGWTVENNAFVSPGLCSAPWGASVPNDGTITAFQTSSVPFGSTCTQETRSCSDGSLSGSFSNESCSVLASRYPGCNTDDITVGSFILAACNVGSSIAGTDHTNPAIAGRFFQWGENIAWDASSGTASSNNCTWDRDTQSCMTPSLSAWSSSVSDTTTGGADRWFDYGDTRGPCAPGYRVPTNSELIAIHSAGGWEENGSAMQTALQLPYAQIRNRSSGIWGNTGGTGYFWSSSPDSFYANGFRLGASYVNLSIRVRRITGLSIRCLKN